MESTDCKKEPSAWCIKVQIPLLLVKENTFTIHQKNIKKLAIEICKVKFKVALKLMCEFLQKTEHSYNLRNNHTFKKYNSKTVRYGTETLSFMGPKIWSLVPSTINRDNRDI